MEFTQDQTMLAKVVQKAVEDVAFKKALIADPLSTIESFLEHKLIIPEGQKLVVKDQSDDSTIYLNIPRIPDFDDLNLTEEQLEMVAGGSTPACLVVAGVACMAAGVCIGEAIGKMIN